MKRRERGSSMCQLQGPVKVRARAWWGRPRARVPTSHRAAGAETPVNNDFFFFFKPPLTLYKPTVQAHSPQRASQRHSLGVWEKQQIPLAPPTPPTPTTPSSILPLWRRVLRGQATSLSVRTLRPLYPEARVLQT